MKESTQRKLDRIYKPQHRRALEEIYRGDPSDPEVMRKEFIPELPEGGVLSHLRNLFRRR